MAHENDSRHMTHSHIIASQGSLLDSLFIWWTAGGGRVFSGGLCLLDSGSFSKPACGETQEEQYTAMHARAQASNRLAKANRASHRPRVRAKARVKKTMENPKENPKEPKVLKFRTQVLKTRNQRQARKLRNRRRPSPEKYLRT